MSKLLIIPPILKSGNRLLKMRVQKQIGLIIKEITLKEKEFEVYNHDGKNYKEKLNIFADKINEFDSMLILNFFGDTSSCDEVLIRYIIKNYNHKNIIFYREPLIKEVYDKYEIVNINGDITKIDSSNVLGRTYGKKSNINRN